VVKLLGYTPIPGPAGGFYIAAPLFERGSLADALAGPSASELLWYKRCAPLALARLCRHCARTCLLFIHPLPLPGSAGVREPPRLGR